MPHPDQLALGERLVKLALEAIDAQEPAVRDRLLAALADERLELRREDAELVLLVDGEVLVRATLVVDTSHLN